jgi:transposase
MKETVTLNNKEQKRLMVLNQMEAGRCKGQEAADLLDLSLRQIKRLVSAYRKEGASAVAHGNRGRKPPNAIDEALRRRVIELTRGKYAGFNTQHLTESLLEREGISLSRSSVRNILLSAGINSPKKRRSSKHRSRRERYPQEGMLLQLDASPHAWLEGRGPSFTLIGAIDDATGKVPFAFFQEHEDSAGYFKLLREIVKRHGIPLALYHDQHTIFDSPKDESESLEEQLEGKRNLTQFGRLLDELGIVSISAKSPQAKGRVERLWGTFQDRLVSELRLSQVKTMEEANSVLAEYLLKFNRTFQVTPKESGIAYRKVNREFVPDRYFCFKYKRIVGGDNVIKFNGRRLQVKPTNGRASYAHARVEVHIKLDAELAVYYQGNYLLTGPAPAEAPLQRALSEPRESLTQKINPGRYKPSPEHPWRGAFKDFVKQGR